MTGLWVNSHVIPASCIYRVALLIHNLDLLSHLLCLCLCQCLSPSITPTSISSIILCSLPLFCIHSLQHIPYLSAVGALQYLATMTRPDIAYAVSYLGRFNSNPGPRHWTAAKHLMRYCKGTMDYKLTYSGPLEPELFTTFCDASHGDCKDSGRSTGGYLTKVCGGAVSWSSKLQPVVALSTTEAEYIAAVEAGKEIVWMRNLLGELGYPVTMASSLFIDNESAVTVSKNPEHHGRMKHLDLRFYWLRDEVAKGRIEIVHLRTSDMPADILTKSLPKPKVLDMVRMLGLQT